MLLLFVSLTVPLAGTHRSFGGSVVGPLPRGHAWHRHEHLHPGCLCAQARADTPCHRDPALLEMYALVRSEALLEGRLNRLTHQVSLSPGASLLVLHESLLEPCLGLSSPVPAVWEHRGPCLGHHRWWNQRCFL